MPSIWSGCSVLLGRETIHDLRERLVKFRRTIALSFLLYIVQCSVAFAQVVEIPDPNLRAAIAETLNIPHNAPITQGDMDRLTDLVGYDRGIQNITGLEFATNFKVLYIDDNPITDLTPLAALTQLKHLGMYGIPGADLTPLSKLTNLESLDAADCDIVDVSPLAQLTKLTSLNLRNNLIVDVGPLANLTNLVELRLNTDLITDVTLLAHLTRLNSLEIYHNKIVDHSPLNALPLSHFIYDQTCKMSPLPLEPRLNNRTFPSIFARWSGIGWPPVTNRPELSDIENLALHDLRFSVDVFGLRFLEGANEFKIAGDLDEAIRQRDKMLALNPNMITLADVGMRAAPRHWFPDDWPYWIRDEHGDVFVEIRDGQQLLHRGFMDFTHPHIQDRIVQQAIAVAKCGLYDGIFFDFWTRTGLS